ncbi:SDR family NAD(P)-dependent oxidoreductase [Pseudonocardia adelaidensis]|uniref:SDR family oxidoreductase n=1 Tax=Pseudonocardia adelaidensis TaxID=648754 RepID=A0ABP9NP76_9PSEU
MLEQGLKGRLALVTGAGRGLGHAIAEAFAERGALVLAGDVSPPVALPDRLDPIGPRVEAIPLDVTDEASVRAAVQLVVASGMGIDVLVNNAGIMYKAPVEETDLESWRRVLDVNLTGAQLCTKHVVPVMKRHGRGRIISIASMTAAIGMETYSAYSASKAALVNLTKVWAAELATAGITANAICPGWVDTPMAADAFVAHLARIHGTSPDEARERLLARVPQHRFLDPREIAHTALFLADDLAAGISGEAIHVDTGLVATFAAGLHRPAG